jgi:hypothetical protein
MLASSEEFKTDVSNDDNLDFGGITGKVTPCARRHSARAASMPARGGRTQQMLDSRCVTQIRAP